MEAAHRGVDREGVAAKQAKLFAEDQPGEGK
jgi:hypothetical protein